MVKARSKSKQNIINVAFEHFTMHGYEGASLGLIAEAVGIRKASIYTHFKSKDELFLEILEDALEIETSYLIECFSENNDTLPGELYLRNLKTRYESAITCRFLTRTAYVAPPHLTLQVTRTYQNYIAQLKEKLHSEMNKIFKSSADLDLYIEAYLGIFDSLCAELLYDGSNYDRRLATMLMLYQQSMHISKASL